MNIAIFASGNGSNAQAIIDKSAIIGAKVVCIVCDNPQAFVITRAKNANIPCLVTDPKDFGRRDEWEQNIVEFVNKFGVKLIVLAGFMRIVSKTLLEAFPKRIINIHPSLLPQFPGRNGIKDAFEAKVSKSGVTIHYVDSGIDTGEIIYQEALNIDPKWTLAQFEEKIHKIEHRIYPKVIQNLIKELR